MVRRCFPIDRGKEMEHDGINEDVRQTQLEELGEGETPRDTARTKILEQKEVEKERRVEVNEMTDHERIMETLMKHRDERETIDIMVTYMLHPERIAENDERTTVMLKTCMKYQVVDVLINRMIETYTN